MARQGTIKWFNPNKGWGFVTDDNDGTDYFIRRQQCKGWFVETGNRVTFTVGDGQKGKEAQELMLIDKETDPTKQRYLGVVSAYNSIKGYGFIKCDACTETYGKDVFMLRSDLPGGERGGYAPQGAWIKFTVIISDHDGKPLAQNIDILGQAGYEVKDNIRHTSAMQSFWDSLTPAAQGWGVSNYWKEGASGAADWASGAADSSGKGGGKGGKGKGRRDWD
eukprot:gnl/TRDRNA2_/TRDRNA2_155083_c1_seq4.p1 gnl/TRDRNA2_/TRDRNA2_155083_c1~~gnl/TRDRNA2_/TRDRNA2_155083_c1_seq4.p1  ORF type:complete len:221 (+),score=44.92 gnl/TRDRNA2_/TRDRNA2_155083_c1_seq4:86-748(+)